MKNIAMIGIDLGDKSHTLCALDRQGDVVDRATLPATREAVTEYFAACEPTRVAIEAGTHSPWVARAIEQRGHRVIVANPRQVPLIYRNQRKCDDLDAETLARLARSDPKLLRPLSHRGVQAQTDLTLLRSRDALVKSRTALINHARGQVKSYGERLAKCSAQAFARRVAGEIPEALRPSLEPVLTTIKELTARIRKYDRDVERLCADRYGETARLRQVAGVGPLTALSFVLTVEDPHRFSRRRSLGAYFGLVPERDQSGEVDKQLRITKAGDAMLRRLLVSAAH